MEGGDYLDRYARRGHTRVEGWLTTSAIAMLRALAAAQARLGIAGPVAEIGVHHGRLFILLHLMTVTGERAVAYDLFEAQDENVDGSGKGDRAVFERNLRRHGGRPDDVVIRAVNSLRLQPAQVIADAGGKPRLFSIDGGHTAEITASDLALAEASVCDGGVIVLDDFFNEAWPGVAEGTCRHLLAGSRLVPVAIGGNKVVLTTGAEPAAAYRAALQSLDADHRLSERLFFGRRVVCIERDDRSALRRAIAATPLWKSLRETPAGRRLRRLLPGG